MEFTPIINLFEKLEKTSKRSEKTYYIAQFLQRIEQKNDIKPAVLLIQGTVFNANENEQLGISIQLVQKALSVATGYSKSEITKLWKEKGDLGLVGEIICNQKKQNTLFTNPITLQKIYENLHKLATFSGDKSVQHKVQLIAELLTQATGLEAKYIIRFILEVMRLGIGKSTLRDAIVWAYMPKVNHLFFFDIKSQTYIPTTIGFTLAKKHTKSLEELDRPKCHYKNQPITEIHDEIIICDSEKTAREVYTTYTDFIQKAIDTTNDIVLVTQLAYEQKLDELSNVKPKLFFPIQVMLAQKVTDTTQALEAIPAPCFCEYKYDGFRIQIHKQNNNVEIFTRRLENVTTQFPDIVEAVINHVTCTECILDAEAVGYDINTKKYTAFQEISQRIRRKYNIDLIQKEFPVEVNIFDCMQIEQDVCLNLPFIQRRKLLEKHIQSKDFILKISTGIQIQKVVEMNEFYAKSLQSGNEGIMIKSLQTPYKPGSRVGHMIKLKPIMETLDLVITSATWGEGKRANWLTSFGLSCIDEDENLFEIGRVGSGFKEDESTNSFSWLTTELQKHSISENNKTIIVRPVIVLEVSFEEIQKSNSYSSGFALRFPRVVRIREKGIHEVTPISLIQEYYNQQRGRQNE